MGKFATFVLGGIVGAGAAFFLSPRTGEENRKLVGDMVNESYPQAAQLQDKAGQIIEGVASTSTKLINTVVDKGQDVYNGVTNSQMEVVSVAVPEVFSEKNEELRQKIDAARERIATQVAKNAEAVHDAAMDKAPLAVDAANSAVDVAKTAFAGASDSAKTAVDAAKDVATAAAGTARDVAFDAATKAKDAVENAASSIKK